MSDSLSESFARISERFAALRQNAERQRALVDAISRSKNAERLRNWTRFGASKKSALFGSETTNAQSEDSKRAAALANGESANAIFVCSQRVESEVDFRISANGPPREMSAETEFCVFSQINAENVSEKTSKSLFKRSNIETISESEKSVSETNTKSISETIFETNSQILNGENAEAIRPKSDKPISQQIENEKFGFSISQTRVETPPKAIPKNSFESDSEQFPKSDFAPNCQTRSQSNVTPISESFSTEIPEKRVKATDSSLIGEQLIEELILAIPRFPSPNAADVAYTAFRLLNGERRSQDETLLTNLDETATQSLAERRKEFFFVALDWLCRSADGELAEIIAVTNSELRLHYFGMSVPTVLEENNCEKFANSYLFVRTVHSHSLFFERLLNCVAEMLCEGGDEHFRVAATQPNFESLSVELAALKTLKWNVESVIALKVGKEIAFDVRPFSAYNLLLSEAFRAKTLCALSFRFTFFLIFALLSERSVLFVSERYAVAASALTVFLSLIQPFSWPFPAIYVLKPGNLGLLQAPIPTVAALRATAAEARRLRAELPNHIIALLDEDAVLGRPTEVALPQKNCYDELGRLYALLFNARKPSTVSERRADGRLRLALTAERKKSVFSFEGWGAAPGARPPSLVQREESDLFFYRVQSYVAALADDALRESETALVDAFRATQIFAHFAESGREGFLAYRRRMMESFCIKI